LAGSGQRQDKYVDEYKEGAMKFFFHEVSLKALGDLCVSLVSFV
jgi:hypothetical protein